MSDEHRNGASFITTFFSVVSGLGGREQGLWQVVGRGHTSGSGCHVFHIYRQPSPHPSSSLLTISHHLHRAIHLSLTSSPYLVNHFTKHRTRLDRHKFDKTASRGGREGRVGAGEPAGATACGCVCIFVAILRWVDGRRSLPAVVGAWLRPQHPPPHAQTPPRRLPAAPPASYNLLTTCLITCPLVSILLIKFCFLFITSLVIYYSCVQPAHNLSHIPYTPVYNPPTMPYILFTFVFYLLIMSVILSTTHSYLSQILFTLVWNKFTKRDFAYIHYANLFTSFTVYRTSYTLPHLTHNLSYTKLINWLTGGSQFFFQHVYSLCFKLVTNCLTPCLLYCL